MDNNTLEQTYVRHGDQWFFVSTINRASSAQLAPELWYAETIAWRCDVNGKRGEMIGMDEDHRDNRDGHIRIVNELRDHGRIRDDDDE